MCPFSLIQIEGEGLIEVKMTVTTDIAGNRLWSGCLATMAFYYRIQVWTYLQGLSEAALEVGRGRAGAGVVPSAALCAYLVPGSLNSLELTYLGACP